MPGGVNLFEWYGRPDFFGVVEADPRGGRLIIMAGDSGLSDVAVFPALIERLER